MTILALDANYRKCLFVIPHLRIDHAVFYTSSSRAWSALADFEAELEDELDGFERRIAVELALLVGQVVVGDKAGMVLGGIIAAGAIGPALRDTGGSPHFMHVATHVVDERSKFGGQTDVRCVYGMGFILGFGHDCGNNC